MVEISSPLSKENRIQISRSASGLTGDRSLILSQNPFLQNQVSGPDPQTIKILEENQNSLSIVSSGILSLRQRIDSLTSSLSSLSDIINNNNVLENFRENQRIEQEKRLADQALRYESEAAIERKIESSITPTVSNVAEKTTSGLNSMMDVFSKLFLGWLGYQGINFLQNQINGNLDRLNQIRQNVTGDFDSVENVFLGINSGFKNISDTILGLSGNIAKSVAEGLIVNPFKSLFGLFGNDQNQNQNQQQEQLPQPQQQPPNNSQIQSNNFSENFLQSPTPTIAPEPTNTFLQTPSFNLNDNKALTSSFLDSSPIIQKIENRNIFDFDKMIPSLMASNTNPKLNNTGESFDQVATSKVSQKSELNSSPFLTSPVNSTKVESDQNLTVPPIQQQTPLINPKKVQQQSEKLAENVTPRENLSISFSDQITNINKILTETNNEDKSLAMNMSSVLGNGETPKIENYYSQFVTENTKDEFIFSKSEKSFIENVPKSEVSVGPLAKSQPNIIITPIPQPQQKLSSKTSSSTGSNDVPAIPSSNLDNFYILYSKVHYNII